MEDSDFLRSFHALLVKQMFGQAKFSYALEKILNPFLGNQNVTTLENEQRNFLHAKDWIITNQKMMELYAGMNTENLTLGIIQNVCLL